MGYKFVHDFVDTVIVMTEFDCKYRSSVLADQKWKW